MLLAERDFNVEIWRENLLPPRDILLEKVQGIDGLYCLLTDTIDETLLS